MSIKASSIKRKRSRKKIAAQIDLSTELRFSPGSLLSFFICALGLFALSIWLPESAFDWLNENTARMAAYCLSLAGMQPVLHGRTLSLDGFAIVVWTECSTLYMGILFFSFVAACPAALRQKLIGLPLGISVLHAGNILRIATIFAIGANSRSLFEIVHVYFGQILMVLLVLAVSLSWLNMWAEPSTRNRELLTFFIRFIAFTSIPFLLWLPLNRQYVELAYLAAGALFSLFGYQLLMAPPPEIHYHAFNIVTFTGLVLASRTPPPSRKFAMLAAGHVILFAALILRVCCVLILASRNGPADRVGAGIALCTQYILPVLLWLLLIPKKKDPEKLRFGQMGRRRQAPTGIFAR